MSAQATAERTTQGFVATVTSVRQHPMAVVYEVLWRWLFGVPALLLLATQARYILANVPWQASGVGSLTIGQVLTDPPAAAGALAAFMAAVGPPVRESLRWIVPVLLVAWVVVSAVGRGFVLRALDSSLHRRTGALVVLQGVRVLPLVLFAGVWLTLHRAVASATVLTPGESGADSNVMLYVGLVIVLTLGLFVLASGLGYASTLSPILAMRENLSPLQAMRSALAARGQRSNLVEINLVLGIVKIALVVFAMVFSATPLPFQAVTTPEFLFAWNVFVTLGYLVASDFFHVARLAAYLRLIPHGAE